MDDVLIFLLVSKYQLNKISDFFLVCGAYLISLFDVEYLVKRGRGRGCLSSPAQGITRAQHQHQLQPISRSIYISNNSMIYQQ